MIEEITAIFSDQAKSATTSNNESSRLLSHMLAHTLCKQRHCITGLLRTMGKQHEDWSAHFRLYASKIDTQALFHPIIKGAIELLDKSEPIVLAIDDSQLPKTGRKILESGYYRDPLSPPFHVNLIRALKFVQISIAVPEPQNPKRARMIPVAFKIIPKLKKPPKDATEEQISNYELLKEQNTVAVHSISLLKELREFIDKHVANGKKRSLVLCGDGHYTVENLLQNLPHDTSYLGRTRSDINICEPAKPSLAKRKGRKPSYGKKLLTPEELRKSDAIPWQELYIDKNCGQTRVRYKLIQKAKWHKAGEKQLLQIVVIAPLRYKKKKNGPWSYTKPAYLLCTDPHMSVEKLIQTYLWRWDIEVNFKEQKQIFGIAQAQVRRKHSVQNAPAVGVAAYAGLLLAYVRLRKENKFILKFNPPKWYQRKPNTRPSTAMLLEQISCESNSRIFDKSYFSDFTLN